MKAKKIRGIIMLSICAMMWGSAFAAQDVGMELTGPFTFGAVRYLVGGLILIPLVLLIRKLDPPVPEKKKEVNRSTVIAGIVCGSVLFISSSLQQVGMAMGVDSGKAGFLTAMYIVIVPVIGIFMKRKPPVLVWAAVAISLVGMYFLCINGKVSSITLGDILTILCAVCFSVHIIAIDRFSQSARGVELSCIQFFVCSVLSAPFMFVLERPSVGEVWSAILPILYCGVFSCGVAYTLQIITQKHLSAAIAALVMSLESVFAALTGWVLLGQRLSGREFTGCALIFAAVVIAQLDFKKKVIKT